MGAGATGVDNTFRNLDGNWCQCRIIEWAATTYPLMIKALDLLAEDEILEKCRTTFAYFETVLILNGTTDISRHENIRVIEVELREEVFSIGSSVVGIATLETGHFARHVWTGRIRETNQPCTKYEQLHHVGRGEELDL